MAIFVVDSYLSSSVNALVHAQLDSLASLKVHGSLLWFIVDATYSAAFNVCPCFRPCLQLAMNLHM